jgi:CheY-like chemotaxis protein
MHEYADRFDHLLGDRNTEIIIALALVVVAGAVIIWLWSRRTRGLRRGLEAALGAAGSAATHAAVAHAVDGLRLSERDGDTEVTPAPPHPVAIPAESYEATSANASSPAAGHLLLVEDDVNVARPYRLLLESRGYTVRHAVDGVEGLDAARRERPDLVLLDVMMPRMNGISLLKTLREDADLRTVPAVMLSNFHESRMVERAMGLGALAYIVKAQMRPEMLIGAIPHWLRGQRAVDA